MFAIVNEAREELVLLSKFISLISCVGGCVWKNEKKKLSYNNNKNSLFSSLNVAQTINLEVCAT